MRMKSFLLLSVLALALVGCSPEAKPVPKEPETPPVATEKETPVTEAGQKEPVQEQKPESLGKPVKTVEPPVAKENKSLFHWASTKEEGLKKAKAMDGFVLLKFEAEWCGPCQIMKREAFQDAGFAKTIDKAVVVPVDVDSEMGLKLAREYQADQIPKLVFLKPSGDKFGEIMGYMNVEWLEREVNTIFKKANYRG